MTDLTHELAALTRDCDPDTYCEVYSEAEFAEIYTAEREVRMDAQLEAMIARMG